MFQATNLTYFVRVCEQQNVVFDAPITRHFEVDHTSVTLETTSVRRMSSSLHNSLHNYPCPGRKAGTSQGLAFISIVVVANVYVGVDLHLIRKDMF